VPHAYPDHGTPATAQPLPIAVVQLISPGATSARGEIPAEACVRSPPPTNRCPPAFAIIGTKTSRPSYWPHAPASAKPPSCQHLRVGFPPQPAPEPESIGSAAGVTISMVPRQPHRAHGPASICRACPGRRRRPASHLLCATRSDPLSSPMRCDGRSSRLVTSSHLDFYDLACGTRCLRKPRRLNGRTSSWRVPPSRRHASRCARPVNGGLSYSSANGRGIGDPAALARVAAAYSTLVLPRSLALR